MSNDDDPTTALTTSLRAAFRAQTRDLTYRGPIPRPRSTAWAAAPAAGLLVAAGAVALVPTLAGHDGSAAPQVAPSLAVPPSATGPKHHAQRREIHGDFTLTSFTRALHRGSPGSAQLVLHGTGDGEVRFLAHLDGSAPPDDAAKVDVDGPGSAYVGQAEGLETLWVDPSGDGQWIVVTSQNATEAQMVDLLHDPRPVPAVN